MFYLAIISFILIIYQFITVVINFIFHQNIKNEDLLDNPEISILIPVRNEEKNISDLLENLKNLKLQNLEIIIYDDLSTDNTCQIIEKYINQNTRIKLIKGKELPEGWLGKNYACYNLAINAHGKYFLFIDADVRLYDDIVSSVVSYSKKHNLGLLSIFPIQILETFGEKISVPIMNYILVTLLPLIFVRKSPFSAHSAANGQFMLFDSDIYKWINPHEKFKYSQVEDINIARYFKKLNIKIACITGDKRVKCRMYTSYKEALNGFAKNIFMFFGNKPTLAFLFWLFVTFGFVPVMFFNNSILIIYFLLLIVIQILYSILTKQNPFLNLLLFPLQLIFMIHVMFYSILRKNKKDYQWKERIIRY
ncbi:MAG: glycosyltransferase [Bacteroidales bacterium]|jgi:glycosyltransferase involved in cell wall biosynthesis|nr:glycosyltransferase [Bacteroidales bacterium]